MEIRHCTTKDITECANLLKEVYSQPEYNENWKDSEAEAYLSRFYKIEPELCFVAIDKSSIVGAIFSYSYPWQSETLVYIQELYVSPKHRKKGIARSLLNTLPKSKAWLVANDNTSASEFYKKMGFSTNSPYKFNYGKINT